MNKQQLASAIWEAANKMRSKIEANEYKDYILGFIFYKFLSDNEEKHLRNVSYYCDEDIEALLSDSQIEKLRESKSEEELADILQNLNKEINTCIDDIGYFIPYDYLFSTWLKKGSDFNVGDVRDALSSFSRHINKSHAKVFDKIFNTLETGLSKLGESAGAQTKAVSDLIHLIRRIPMDEKQDYDVLGFIYEYLISNFAANAGKKAGEFYTPHEVSLLMSEIVAEHLKDRKEISIYDPTSGSGSLLINIGKAIAKHNDNKDSIKYYAQELKENTYNLTRMNLVMRGIIPANSPAGTFMNTATTNGRNRTAATRCIHIQPSFRTCRMAIRLFVRRRESSVSSPFMIRKVSVANSNAYNRRAFCRFSADSFIQASTFLTSSSVAVPS